MSIRAALEQRLATLTPSWPTAWEGVDFTIPAGSCWQRAKLLLSETVPLGMSAGAPAQWNGTFHITAWSPAGTGPKLVEDRAALVMARFPRGLVLGNLTILQPSLGPVLDSDPKWYGLPVLVPFVYQP